MDKQRLQEFLALPVDPEGTWQGGVVMLSDLMGIPPEEAPVQVGTILWRCVSSDLTYAQPVMAAAEDAFEPFCDAMLELWDEHELYVRPARIECNLPYLADELNRLLDGSGTVAQHLDELSGWSDALEELADGLQGEWSPELPTLRDAGCSDRQIREFAAAAAEFYRVKLWELLDDSDLIQIESPRPPRTMRYAVVLGAGGQSYGLGFYADDEDHHALAARQVEARELHLFSCLYEDPVDVASDDVFLWQQLGLQLDDDEAFPDANQYSPEGVRRPTPQEIDFLTIVLKGLAQTAEAELDGGRWTKSVRVAGKVRKCTFSIPNLLDPPDRAEWVRRGKMPDPRGHEIHMRRVQEFIASVGDSMDIDELNAEINARFAGQTLEDLELPRGTPAERAEAIYQEALDCFGRRRVLLAREALAEDPLHVSAGLLVAEAARGEEARIDKFRSVKQAAAAELGPKLEEFAGHFWGLQETRPFMRACHGLACALADAGQPSEAIEQYQEMLRLNPNDNQGVRDELVPLLLEQDRDAEAAQVLDRYPEATAMWSYLNALVEFRRGGNSARAQAAIRAAFKVNDHVMRLLQTAEPPLLPDTYALGSPEEAAICIDELETVWQETEGFLQWMFQEYFVWERDRAKKLRDQRRKVKGKQKKKRKS